MATPLKLTLLIACADEASRRSLESVLTSAGHHVITAETAAALLDEVARRPDAIILDASLTEPPDFTLCRTVRSHPYVSPATPIILTTSGAALRSEHIAALRAGAWELRGEPIDAEDLLLRLTAYTQGKVEADRIGAEDLIDQDSGLYNAIGMIRRSEELAALTIRQHMPLACAVFRAVGTRDNEVDGDRLATAFKHVGRISDVVARTRPTEFAVFAPATDESGVQELVHRIGTAVAHVVNGGGGRLRAGVSVGIGTDKYRPADLLARARRALETA